MQISLLALSPFLAGAADDLWNVLGPFVRPLLHRLVERDPWAWSIVFGAAIGIYFVVWWRIKTSRARQSTQAEIEPHDSAAAKNNSAFKNRRSGPSAGDGGPREHSG